MATGMRQRIRTIVLVGIAVIGGICWIGCRTFAYEPFRMPSASMQPTLTAGDYIMVSKSAYGVRSSFSHKVIVQGNAPRRGDVVVFRYPVDPNVNYVKRVVGLPGDTVVYQGKRLTVNGEAATYATEKDFRDGLNYQLQFTEHLAGVGYKVLNSPQPLHAGQPFPNFPMKEACVFEGDSVEDFRCKVPAGQYFVLGDNRDNSQDSRYWGFVPDENLIGKVISVWMNFDDAKRIGAIQ